MKQWRPGYGQGRSCMVWQLYFPSGGSHDYQKLLWRVAPLRLRTMLTGRRPIYAGPPASFQSL
ncbi:hypothetical protein [Arachidicoccus sp.]|uniref:hypothetical protein n=1 Tax=Arachidicoccus sp. TaxID=1872624 RepID=UPI003D24AFF0